jgi:hypothetical protein
MKATRTNPVMDASNPQGQHRKEWAGNAISFCVTPETALELAEQLIHRARRTDVKEISVVLHRKDLRLAVHVAHD